MLQENFISLVAQDRGAEARQVLQDDLSARVLDHLETRKHELAKGLFSGSTQQVTEAEEKKDDEKHDDEKADEKLVKKLVKKDCLTEK